jgi:uncharacterized coiled-coil DUF342 family protein
MTDHTNTYPDLVNVEDWLNAKGYTGEAGACHQAMSLIRSQEKRIADLRKEADMMHSEYKTARARIAELERELACSIVSGNDAHERALGYVYELNDAAEMLANQARTLKEWHERIVELKAALKPFVDEAQFYHPMFKDEELAAENTFDFTIGDLRAARAAYLRDKE